MFNCANTIKLSSKTRLKGVRWLQQQNAFGDVGKNCLKIVRTETRLHLKEGTGCQGAQASTIESAFKNPGFEVWERGGDAMGREAKRCLFYAQSQRF